MAELYPQPLSDLLRRMLAEHARHGSIFDLPERSFWRGSPLDLSDRVARWLDGLRDAGTRIAALRDCLAPDLRAFADVSAPAEIYDCVTLSTFHGCPAGEIERIVEHLITRHGLHVVIKLNPTLLG